MNNRTILATGCAGFIGSNFIRNIIKKYPECKIVNLDKLTYAGNPDNLKDIENNPNYTFIKGDICNPYIVNKAAKGADLIVNFAAESHVDRSIKDPAVFLKTDIIGTHVLLEAVRKFNIQKFIQISTDEVYGSIKEGSFKESDTLKPSSPYSASKASADLLINSYITTYNIPAIITRSSNNFGPYQYPEKLIPLFITNLLEGKKVPLYGKGLNIRDWVYVIDNCEAIEFVIKEGKCGEIYNIAANNERTNMDITKTILKVLGKDELSIEPVKDRPGHDFRYSIDCKKINRLGWKPRFNFEDAIKETVEWYKNNVSWWKRLK